MKQTMHSLFIGGLVLGLATAAGCSSPPAGAQAPEETSTQSSKLITSEDCMAGSKDGKVGICHATGVFSARYTHIRVSTNACISGHGAHPGDFVSDDPTCPVCGNGVVENGETCDPIASCPATCDDGNACTIDAMTGSPATCNSVCTHVAQTACISFDGCCPAGCNANNDADCAPVCGNGVRERGEICDPPSACQQTCDDGNACTVDQMTGSPATCNALCLHSPLKVCLSGDGCCPAGCTINTDSDCPLVCTPQRTLQQLLFHYLGRACDQPADVVFWINNEKTGNQDREIARVPLVSSCTNCEPGVQTVEVTDPALLELAVNNGANIFRVTTTGTLSWATVYARTPTRAMETAIWAAWPSSQGWPNYSYQPTNMCTSGMQTGLTLSGVSFTLTGGVECSP
jgi:hypothetical protein